MTGGVDGYESSESRMRAKLTIMELAHVLSVPMALKAVVKLRIPDALWQGGANTPLTPAEILSRIGNAATDPENLLRVLRMLSSYGVFQEHFGSDSVPKYSLTEVGKTLVSDADGISYGQYVLFHYQEELVRAWSRVDEVVLDPRAEPFTKLNGEPLYDYITKRPEMTELLIKGMSGTSVPLMKAVLSRYDGFQGVETLVDVGGNGGECLKMILQKYPNIRQAINFDLPGVVAKAPHIPGVTHVGGDIFKSVPSADAIFMKWMLTTWADEECKVIMDNCYKALPTGGKLIACEPMLPDDAEDSARVRALVASDVYLMSVTSTGKVRTQHEFMQLGLSAGFSHFRPLVFDYFYTILEFQIS